MRTELDTEVLPCGCLTRRVLIDGERVLEIVPCHSDCINLRNALELAAEAGKPVKRRRAP
jgi:hypothetical protein